MTTGAFDVIIPLAAVVICAVADRLRGGLLPKCRHCDLAGELVYGLALAVLLGLPELLWPVLSVLWLLGARPGWGYPMGQALLGKIQHAWAHPNAQPEWWQVGPLKSRPWLSLVVRGAMWAAPCLPLAFWHPQVWALLGMAVAMPAGALLDRTLTYRWQAGEWVRGALIGVICWLA